ncbi:hypothetical protein BN14_03903 [Rhizoctonia solani AG-1 IB]|uniref:Uncharacterized protein n=1 Tax=Thanatephorus cucumeris (strain AG1-IB / isolate 7/3/14) TaxID=1108050 RepID=M5C1Y5_THACB|nr:hypothetical protein BN14_03903 [Rhizoctonia solani AG-1 IB]
MLMNPTSEESRNLLNTSKILEDRKDPWWMLDNHSQEVLPAIKQVSSSLLGGKFNHLLLFNVFHVSLTYAYTVRTFAVSSLSTQASDEIEEIRKFILPLSPFLQDRKSTITFTSVDGVVTDWVSRLPESPKPKLLKVLSEDAKEIFHAESMVEVEEGSESQLSNHTNCMRFLSDVHALFDGPKKHAHIAHKLMFYLGFLVNLPTPASGGLLNAINAWQAKHPEDEQDASQADTARPRTLIEEMAELDRDRAGRRIRGRNILFITLDSSESDCSSTCCSGIVDRKSGKPDPARERAGTIYEAVLCGSPPADWASFGSATPGGKPPVNA